MRANIKLPILCFTLFTFLFISNTNAQSCDEAFGYARQEYYNGKYESVAKWLIICLNDFENNKNNYLNNNEARVFQVYKLLTASYYDNDYDYLAEEKEQLLITYFRDRYNPGDVLNRLANTAF